MKLRTIITTLFILGILLAVGISAAQADYVITLEDKSADGTRIVKYTNSKALTLNHRVIRKKNKKNNNVYLYYRKSSSRGANFVPAELTYNNRVFKKLKPVYITYHTRELSSRGGGKRARTIDITKVIEGEARRYNVDPLLIYLIMKYESNFNNYAVSRSGAMGLMQLMPGTAGALGVRNAYDPFENVAGGVSYFITQLSRFGNLRHALAAYNAGPGKVKKYCGVPPYSETYNYVENITSDYYYYRNKMKKRKK